VPTARTPTPASVIYLWPCKKADTLEWAGRNDVISTEQREIIMAEAYRRAEADRQELTLVHFSAQFERFLWDRGCA
jgi:hypothetical protein